jgi:hypothetical protein
MYFEYINGKRYVKEIMGFTSLGKNKYRISTRVIDPETDKQFYEDSYETTITDNYTFWKVLGKYNSCEWNDKTKKY